MLEFIRNRAQGIFAWIIVGGIILTFALFGINQYFTGGGDTSVAKVNGAEISQGRLEQAYYQQRQRLAEMFGGELPPMFTEKMLKQQVLSQLVAQEVMVQAALDNGMRVGDMQLASIIRSADAFFENGEFSRSKYEQLLRQQGMTPAVFESRVARDILAAQFQSGFSDTAFVTDAEVDSLLRLQNQQRTIGYLTVSLAPFVKAASVSDEEVDAYYQSNQQRFMLPERVKVDYLELNAGDLARDITVDEQSLRARYEAQKINYATPEERQASHILIQADEKAPQEQLDAAREKAEAILARIRNGEDFAELARAESDDPGSAKQGGDLGFFGRGAMVPAFEEAAFALEAGQVSDVVQSPFGFHIIKLTAIRGGEVEPFAKVKDKIRKDIQNEKAEQRFYDMAEQLANLTYEHPESLQLASEELGLPVKTSVYFTRQGGEGIAASPKVRGAAFGEDVLVRGNNSETIELARNHMLVLRINDHQPEKVRPLEEVQEQIVEVLKREKALEEAKALSASLLQKLHAGEAPTGLAAADSVQWQAKQTIGRDNSEVNGAILDRAFSMPAPGEGAISSDTVALRSGDQAVVVLYSVRDGDPAAADEAERQQAREQLLRAASNAATEAAMRGVRGRMDITTRK
jgi:peptidyl-prolyl cis-trans isomerase D